MEDVGRVKGLECAQSLRGEQIREGTVDSEPPEQLESEGEGDVPDR